MKKLEVGNTVRFEYNGKNRIVKIEKVKKSAGNAFVGPCPLLITGLTYDGDNHTLSGGVGYRSFSVEKMVGLELVG